MTNKYKTKEHCMKQVISYFTTEEKGRLRNYCYENGLTMTGLIRREILPLIENVNK